MKPLYKKYETDKAEALLVFNLVALLANTEAELSASELDRLCIRLVRPQISGALLLSEKNFAGNYVATEGDEVSVHLLMPSGKNRLTIEVEFGTNTRTLAIVDLFTSASASGVFEPEAITTPVVKQLAVAPEDFQQLTEKVGEVEQTANDAKDVADAAQTAATGAQGAAEAAQQTAESVNEALQEVISTGDIPAATVAKVAEHTTQIEQIKTDINGYIFRLQNGVITDGYLSSNSGEYGNAGDQYKGKLFDVSLYKGKEIKIIPHNITDEYDNHIVSSYAFLQDNNLVVGQVPNYAGNYTKPIELTDDDTPVFAKVPEDAQYIWVYYLRTAVIEPDLLPEVSISKTLMQENPMTGRVLVAAVLDADNDDARYYAAKQLFDIAKRKMQDPNYTPSQDELTYSTSGTVVILPNNSAMYQQYPLNLYPLNIFSKNGDTQSSPASTTKVMSLVTGLDFIADINERIAIIDADIAVGGAFEPQVGDIMTIEDLMYGMMIPSSNTCATAFARIAGQKSLALKGQSSPSATDCITEFLSLMNIKTEKIGMVNSVFTSVSGLDPEHTNLTTTNDMVRLAIDACSCPKICKCWGKTTYTIHIGGDNARDVILTKSSEPQEFSDLYFTLGRKTGALYYDQWSASALIMVAAIK